MATVVKLPDQLIELAKPYAIVGHRSIPEQIEFWARLGKAAEENPELPTHFIKNTLFAIAEADACQLNTHSQKKTISAKAKRLGLPVSELMHRGATAYNSAAENEELDLLADAAMAAANRASESIDDVLSFVAASDKRIADMEAKPIKDMKAV